MENCIVGELRHHYYFTNRDHGNDPDELDKNGMYFLQRI